MLRFSHGTQPIGHRAVDCLVLSAVVSAEEDVFPVAEPLC
jgi:hypothetical protein